MFCLCFLCLFLLVDGAGHGWPCFGRWQQYLATLPLMSKTDAQNSSTPWYVSNYLRDTSQKGLPRMPRWHHVRNQVKACKIGKAGTKQWDKVFGGEGMPCTSCAHAVYMLRAWTLSPVYLPYLTTRSLTTPDYIIIKFSPRL